MAAGRSEAQAASAEEFVAQLERIRTIQDEMRRAFTLTLARNSRGRI